MQYEGFEKQLKVTIKKSTNLFCVNSYTIFIIVIKFNVNSKVLSLNLYQRYFYCVKYMFNI
jgi:hypothetical protein